MQWRDWRGLNPWPPTWQAGVMTSLTTAPKSLMVGPERIELSTSCLSGMRSDQLSYEPVLNGESGQDWTVDLMLKRHLLTTNWATDSNLLVDHRRLELRTKRLRVACSTNWAMDPWNSYSSAAISAFFLLSLPILAFSCMLDSHPKWYLIWFLIPRLEYCFLQMGHIRFPDSSSVWMGTQERYFSYATWLNIMVHFRLAILKMRGSPCPIWTDDIRLVRAALWPAELKDYEISGWRSGIWTHMLQINSLLSCRIDYPPVQYYLNDL